MSHVQSSTNPVVDMGRLLARFVLVLFSVWVDLLLGLVPAFLLLIVYFSGISTLIVTVLDQLGYSTVAPTELGRMIGKFLASPETMLFLFLGTVFWAAGFAWIAVPAGWTDTIELKSGDLREKIRNTIRGLVHSHHSALTIVVSAVFARSVVLISTQTHHGIDMSWLLPLAPLVGAGIIYGEIYNSGKSKEAATDLRKLGAILSLGWILIFIPVIVIEHFVSRGVGAANTALVSLLESVRDTLSEPPERDQTLGTEFSRFLGNRLIGSR